MHLRYNYYSTTLTTTVAAFSLEERMERDSDVLGLLSTVAGEAFCIERNEFKMFVFLF